MPEGEQNQGIGVPGWETGRYSSLANAYTLRVDDAMFAKDAAARNPDVVNLILKGPVENVIYPEPPEEQLHEVSLTYSTGSKETCFDGENLRRPSGEVKVDMTTNFGMFLERLFALGGPQYLPAFDKRRASSFKGLVLRIERTAYEFTPRGESEARTAYRFLPTQILGVQGAGFGGGAGAGVMPPVQNPPMAQMQPAPSYPPQPVPAPAGWAPGQPYPGQLPPQPWPPAPAPQYTQPPMPTTDQAVAQLQQAFPGSQVQPLVYPQQPLPVAQPPAPQPPQQAPPIAGSPNGLDPAIYADLVAMAQQTKAMGDQGMYAWLNMAYQKYPDPAIRQRLTSQDFYKTLVGG